MISFLSILHGLVSAPKFLGLQPLKVAQACLRDRLNPLQRCCWLHSFSTMVDGSVFGFQKLKTPPIAMTSYLVAMASILKAMASYLIATTLKDSWTTLVVWDDCHRPRTWRQ